MRLSAMEIFPTEHISQNDIAIFRKSRRNGIMTPENSKNLHYKAEKCTSKQKFCTQRWQDC